jgi:chromosome partitioning protein
MWTLEKVTRLIEEMMPANPSLKSVAVLNRLDPRGADNDDAKEFLKDSPTLSVLEATLGHRKIYANAASKGMGVVEYKPSDDKAIQEIEKVFNLILNLK